MGLGNSDKHWSRALWEESIGVTVRALRFAPGFTGSLGMPVTTRQDPPLRHIAKRLTIGVSDGRQRGKTKWASDIGKGDGVSVGP